MPKLPTMRMIGLLVSCAFLSLPGRAGEEATPPGLPAVLFHGQGFFVRTVDPQKADLRLFYCDDQGHLLHDFVALDKWVASQGQHLVFAANAGMFQSDFKPVGLLVQNGTEQAPLNLNEGAGNFFMKPNGVFVLNAKRQALVIESSSYPTLLSPVIWATQSGPLLVHGGDVHPEFNPDSTNRKVRSGVGVRKDGTIVFALSRAPVTFYDFASFFLIRLKCPNALYLDGDISAFYVPGEKENAARFFGPIFGVVEKAK